jgi:hypothetical protein
MVKTIILVINNTPQNPDRIALYTVAWYLLHSLLRGRESEYGADASEQYERVTLYGCERDPTPVAVGNLGSTPGGRVRRPFLAMDRDLWDPVL